MKLIWSPETALKAYLDTVKSCEIYKDSSVAEFISAMAAGWNAQLIVETWSRGGVVGTSIGLTIASYHTKGRHVCVVPDEETKLEYIEAMENAGVSPREVIVGSPDEVMEKLPEIDFLVVDCRGSDFPGVFRVAKLGHRGAVLVCKNASEEVDFRWGSVLDGGSRIVRSVFLPVGKGLDIAHVGGRNGELESEKSSRWIKRFDYQSGEEIVIRK